MLVRTQRKLDEPTLSEPLSHAAEQRKDDLGFRIRVDFEGTAIQVGPVTVGTSTEAAPSPPPTNHSVRDPGADNDRSTQALRVVPSATASIGSSSGSRGIPISLAGSS